MRSVPVALSLSLLLALSACGGSDDPAPTMNPADPLAGVPDSARRSVAGLIAYGRALLAATGADSAHPVSLDGFTPPVSEAQAPETL